MRIKDIKIGTRLNIVMSLSVTIIIASLGAYTYFNNRGRMIADSDARMFAEVKNLAEIVVRDAKLHNSEISPELKQLFQNKSYYETGYPFLIDKDGLFIIHPNQEGKSGAGKTFFNQLKSSGSEGKTYYLWPEDETGKMKYQYFKYIDELEMYVSASVYEEDILSILNQLRNLILVSVIFGIIVFWLISYLFTKPITRSLNIAIEFRKKLQMEI